MTIMFELGDDSARRNLIPAILRVKGFRADS